MSGLVRTITHWTAGGSRASATDKAHYHFITEWDGTIVKGTEAPEDNIVTSDGDYARHVLNLNTGSIGVAMAGMRGAVESPFDAGPSPLTEKQFEAHCLLLAELHREYSIPVTRKTCLTHAEVQPTLGVIQRGKWDIARLPFKPDLRGAIPVGDYMRERVKSYMAAGGIDTLPAANAPYLRVGMRGEEVAALQRDLARLGYFAGRIDGIYGPRTRAAVLAAQADNGLEADGIAGPMTLSALMASAAPLPARDVTEDDLRKSGSRTIAQADVVAGTAGIGGVVAAINVGNQVGAAVSSAQTWIGAVQEIVTNNWQALVLIGGVLVLWWAARNIKRARVDDAVTGANLKR